jgi:isopentenyl diphosphate isomerase/L-lactate dehydrogenase-like FMN-dependent dehydrogenase
MTENAKGYINSGANHQQALEENCSKFRFVKLNPRVLVNVSETCTKAPLLHRTLSIPFGIAPTSMHCLVHPQGELNTVRAAEAHNTVMAVSTLATKSLEEIARTAPQACKWFQLYITKDRSITERLVKIAQEEGYEALVLTVDAPVLGKREMDMRNKFNLPPIFRLENLERFSEKLKMDSSEGSGLLALFSSQIDKSLTWDDIKWLRSITSIPIVIKGIQCAEDAILASNFS